MVTPITWFNTVVNQQLVRDEYAWWTMGSGTAFGFSNKYTHHEMSWNKNAIKEQERYLNQFFSRQNSINGKTLAEFDTLVIVEPTNEPAYPTIELIKRLREEAKTARNPFKKQECHLVESYDEFLQEEKKTDGPDAAQEFCTGLIDKYIHVLFDVVNKHFGSSVIKAHIWYGFTIPGIYDCLAKAPFDAISLTLYAPNYFDSAYNDALNPLETLQNINEYYQPFLKMDKALVCYEFDAPSTLTGRAYGGFGYMMASLGIQAAAMFTYTPVDIAAYNAGWVVHYLNLYHTPTKAAAFIAGGEIFRKTKVGAPIPAVTDHWSNDYYEVNFREDRVVFNDGKTLIHSASLDGLNEKPVVPERIIGLGNNPYVQHDSNGCYFMDKIDTGTLHLNILPHQIFVNDPFRGKAFRSMANRYVDTNREWIVSRLRERGSVFKLLYPGFERFKVERLEEGTYIEIPVEDNCFHSDPGIYRITKLAGNTRI
jgi:hypothetical protein